MVCKQWFKVKKLSAGNGNHMYQSVGFGGQTWLQSVN